VKEMPNIIETMGYGIGKVHVGVFAYLLEMANEEQNSEAFDFFGELRVKLPLSFVVSREQKLSKRNKVDLAILDKNNRIIMIWEFKVDDHEFKKKIKVDDHEVKEEYKMQTEIYADALEVQNRFFVTLGHGEYYHRPYDDRFKWLKLDDVLKATEHLKDLSSNNVFIRDWIESLKNEKKRRNLSQDEENGREKSQEGKIIQEYHFRAGSWNINFLGKIAEHYREDYNKDDLTCYTYGSHPDTILHFGWSKLPLYAEINDYGMLKIKFNFREVKEEKKKKHGDILKEISLLLQGVLKEEERTFKRIKRNASTMTLYSCDINLKKNSDGNLVFKFGREETISKLHTIISKLYGDNTTMK
jgi:hypothetical protein